MRRLRIACWPTNVLIAEDTENGRRDRREIQQPEILLGTLCDSSVISSLKPLILSQNLGQRTKTLIAEDAENGRRERRENQQRDILLCALCDPSVIRVKLLILSLSLGLRTSEHLQTRP